MRECSRKRVHKKNVTKRSLYITCSVLLGIALQCIVHGLVEIRIISLLTEDFERYGLGLSWGEWFAIHHVASLVLFVAGALLGYRAGVRWWNMIYVEKMHPGLVKSLLKRVR